MPRAIRYAVVLVALATAIACAPPDVQEGVASAMATPTASPTPEPGPTPVIVMRRGFGESDVERTCDGTTAIYAMGSRELRVVPGGCPREDR
jgi:hypothetical protein